MTMADALSLSIYVCNSSLLNNYMEEEIPTYVVGRETSKTESKLGNSHFVRQAGLTQSR